MGSGNGTAWLRWLLVVLISHCGTYKIWCWTYVFSNCKSIHASDVFNTQELLDVMSQSDKICRVIVGGDSISNWRDKVSQKYSKLPGIRELHNFLIVRNPTTNNAMMLLREFCHGGPAKPTTLSLNSGVSPGFNCCPGPSETYHQLGKTRVLQSTKLAHLQQMCSSYIAPERWFEFLKWLDVVIISIFNCVLVFLCVHWWIFHFYSMC